MPDVAISYVGDPDIPLGMTVAEYRRSRPCRRSWWRRVLGRRRYQDGLEVCRGSAAAARGRRIPP
jgi:hypothetical protein